ncbi:hypothetical protein [Prochlorococcus sp. ALOHA_ZT_50]|jgi:hypothetical protein|uniref:hypothetical protein n=1 Tax=Prochlorococcus sp. ALOHA_ZT_50 TaxID=2919303 RepID=UPI00257E3753|nr:hypothetical protein [Prochlorococcus sp. ALOHA_ZT_50]MCH2079572.1 hypothetical protein [Prochlorococcus sp. ALOHA_ZT_50]
METQGLKFLLENWHNPLALIALFFIAVIYVINFLNKKEKNAKKQLSDTDFEHYENLKCIKYNEIITLLETTNKLLAENNNHLNGNIDKLTKILEENVKQNDLLKEKLSEHLIRQKLNTDLLLNIKHHD